MTRGAEVAGPTGLWGSRPGRSSAGRFRCLLCRDSLVPGAWSVVKKAEDFTGHARMVARSHDAGL